VWARARLREYSRPGRRRRFGVALGAKIAGVLGRGMLLRDGEATASMAISMEAERRS
jgi:hypothetical protein